MSFGQFLQILRARVVLILGVAAATLALGIVLSLVLPKRYDATASVMVDPRSADVLATTSPMQAGSEKIDNAISTNIDILASPAVALKAVETLRLEENPRARELLIGGGPIGEFRDQVSRVIAWLLPDDEADDAPRSLKEWMADRLRGNTRMSANRDSRIIRVTYSSPEAQFSADAANALVNAYRATLLQLQVEPAKENTQWLDQQTRELKQTLEEAETKLAKFQQQKGIVATDERMDVETARLADLSGQLALAQSLSYESQAKQRQLRDYLKGGGGEAPAEVSTSPVVQQLKSSIAEREAKLAEMSKRVGPNHPQYVAFSSELEKLRGDLGTEMKAAAQSHLTSQTVNPQREGALAGALNAQRGRVLGMKQDRNELATLMRDVDTAQKSYLAAAQRMSQTRMESRLSNTNGAIVDAAAMPRRPAFPNVPLLFVLALGVGVVAGIGLALVFETVNRLVRSELDLVESLGMPVLAVLGPQSARKRFRRLPAAPPVQALPGMKEHAT